MASSRRSGRAEPGREPASGAADPDPLAALLDAAPRLGEGCVAIAFSGGLDSTVLLHASAAVLPRERLCAVHIDHGLQQASGGWAEHCVGEAAALGVAWRVRKLEGSPAKGESVEAWAREARYQAIGELAREAGATSILTAHHADDQLETFLIRLARGAGVEGLIGIEADRRLEGLRLLRPFLRLPRAVLVQWAHERGLRWIEDPSNSDEGLLRNAIRRQLVPVLDRVLPGVRRQLPTTLAAFAHARALLNERQSADLEAVSIHSNDYGLCLSRSAWRALPPARRAGVLRAWLSVHGARMPSRARLSEMLVQLDSPRLDASPSLRHDGRVLRRYRDLIACVAPAAALAAARPDASGPADSRPVVSILWEGQERIECPALGGTLRIERVDERGIAGLDASWLRSAGLELRRRTGGERLRVRSGGPSRSLKKLFQERGVPPWARTSLPVLWVGDKPVWVPRIGVDADCRTNSGERYRLWWLPDTGEGDPATSRKPAD